MRYFSPLEKQIVSALVGLKNPPENVFGMVMQSILFSKEKLALLIVNQGKDGMLLLPNRDLKTITTSMTEMVEFISLMEFLEKERLIYVQSFPMTCDVSLFYEESSIFEQHLDDELMKVENILNATRPDIPERKNCLFLFSELSVALNFFRKYGGYVYGVDVDCNDIYSRCDMNKIDNILDFVRFTDDEDVLTAAANEYWKPGTHTFMPCYEYLVKSCVVKKCLVEPSEQECFRSNFKITDSIERTDLYQHTLDNINLRL